MEKSLSALKGVGPARIRDLEEAGIRTLHDLALYLPREYRDLTRITPLNEIAAGETCAVRVTVVKPATQVFARGLCITRATVSDGLDDMPVVWYNQPWLKKNLFVGRELLLYGRAEIKNSRMTLNCPIIEERGGLIPVYKPIGKIPRQTLSEMIREAAKAEKDDPLPETLRQRYDLLDWPTAISTAHQPESIESLRAALYRISFENLLMFQLAAGLMRAASHEGVRIHTDEAAQRFFWDSLPFPPTGAQKRVLNEIALDMRAETAMARMVQGDVGCGKTAVAFGAIYMAAKDGWQSAMMAPTEILAEQHYENACRTLEPLGVSCGLLTGSMTPKTHREAREKIRSGEWTAVFGTHALITEDVEYKNLGLVITDEQHRFGVRQRTLLGEKGDHPNVLVMSATPIPRTLSLILYGDLDLSVIDELPPGRKPVKTRIVPEHKRQDMYGFIRSEVRKGRQAYFVCPLVEDSEAVDAQSAEMLYENLKNDGLSDLRVCLVHGKMKAKEKDAAIEQFRNGETDVLVSTTVIEVGVNVPNATVMVVENAERFGLAQLHQLRGRVGRGTDEAWCFLMSDASGRLKILTETNDGFKIAEKDMEIRGPGDLFGTRQSGAILEGALSDGTDAQALKTTHDLARELLHAPAGDPIAEKMIVLSQNWLKMRNDISLSAN